MLASAPIIQALIKALGEKYKLSTDTSSSNVLPPLPPLVIDPVSVSTSNHRLLSSDAIDELVHGWLPLGKIVTPNAVEAGMIARHIRSSKQVSQESSDPDTTHSVNGSTTKEKDDTPTDLGGMVDVAERILDHLRTRSDGEERGVLIKGGHVPLTTTAAKQQLLELKRSPKFETRSIEVNWEGEMLEPDVKEEGFVEILSAYRQALLLGGSNSCTSTSTATTGQTEKDGKGRTDRVVIDVLLTAKGASERCLTIFVAPAIESTSTHGTGCTLSAAIASNIGLGKSRKPSRVSSLSSLSCSLRRLWLHASDAPSERSCETGHRVCSVRLDHGRSERTRTRAFEPSVYDCPSDFTSVSTNLTCYAVLTASEADDRPCSTQTDGREPSSVHVLSPPLDPEGMARIRATPVRHPAGQGNVADRVFQALHYTGLALPTAL